MFLHKPFFLMLASKKFKNKFWAKEFWESFFKMKMIGKPDDYGHLKQSKDKTLSEEYYNLMKSMK